MSHGHPTPPAMEAHRGVWVFLEARNGALRDVSVQLIGEARRIADKRGTDLTGILPGWKVEPLARQAIECGCDRVILVEDPRLEFYTSRPFTKVLATLRWRHNPEVILFGASKNGRDLGGRLHAAIDTGLAADCVRFDVTEEGFLDMIRPAFGGKSLAHIHCEKHRPQMASARWNVFPMPARDGSRSGEVVRETVPLEDADFDTRIVGFKATESHETRKIDDARILVSGGFGLADPKNFTLLEELAALVGGAVASSRKPVDLGWVPKALQVGQTGKTVRPDLYIAVGISGAVQHLAGMQEAAKIVAVNSDPKAAIFEIADYGIVGDLFQVIPEMIRQLKAFKAQGQAARPPEAAPPARPGAE